MMSNQKSYYMGTYYRNAKYPNHKQKNPIKMINPKTLRQQNYFLMKIRTSENSASIQCTSNPQINSKKQFIIAVKGDNQSLVAQKQLQRYFGENYDKSQQKQQRIHSDKNRRKINSQNAQKWHLQGKNSKQQQTAQQLKQFRMIDRQVNRHACRKFSVPNCKQYTKIISRKKNKNKSQFELKDIATIKSYSPQAKQSTNNNDKQNVVTVKSVEQRKQLILHKSSIISSNHRPHKQFSQQNNPIFIQTLPTQIKLNEDTCLIENLKKNRNKKVNNKLLYTYKTKNQHRKSHSAISNTQISYKQIKYSDNHQKEKKNVMEETKIKIKTSQNTIRNNNAKFYTPNKKKGSQKVLNFDGTLDTHQIMPIYHHSRSPFNRPHTSQVYRPSQSRRSSKHKQFLSYKQIARKCESANRKKKASNQIQIKPWQNINNLKQDDNNPFNVSMSSIYDTFQVAL